MCYLKCTLQSILNGGPDYSGIEYYSNREKFFLEEGAAVHRLSRTIMCSDCCEIQWPVQTPRAATIFHDRLFTCKMTQ